MSWFALGIHKINLKLVTGIDAKPLSDGLFEVTIMLNSLVFPTLTETLRSEDLLRLYQEAGIAKTRETPAQTDHVTNA